MITLLAQNLPGYLTDTPTFNGGGDFSKFANFFKPHIYGLSLGFLITRILPFFMVVVGLFFFFRLISAGFAYLTAAGDSAKIQTASKELVNAILGLVVAVGAFFLTQIIEAVFGVKIL